MLWDFVGYDSPTTCDGFGPSGKRGYHGVPYLKRQTQGAVGVVDSSSGELVTQKADGFV